MYVVLQLAVLHNQDLFGSELAEVLEGAARTRTGLAVEPMPLGVTVEDEDVERAAIELVQSGLKVIHDIFSHCTHSP
jgi:hypothetical protein